MTDKEIMDFCRAVDKGEITLPKVKEDEKLIHMDSGSRATIANMHKHFPGATLRQSEAQKEGRVYSSATGEAFPNDGEFTV